MHDNRKIGSAAGYSISLAYYVAKAINIVRLLERETSASINGWGMLWEQISLCQI